MNAYSKFMDISMHALPEPLTSADQSGFQWFKFAHVEYLLDPEVNALSLEAQGVFLRLMSYAAMEVPFASLPDDIQYLVKMAGFKLPEQDSKSFSKAYQHAQVIVKAVLDAAFVLCSDERYYMPLLTNQLSHDAKSTANASNGQTATNQSTANHAGQTSPEKKRTAAAIRQARFRANKKSNPSDVTGVTHNVTDESVTRNALVTPSNVTRNATVTGVTPVTHNVTPQSVTFGGIKGGDLDLDSDLDSKKNKNNLANNAKADPDYFQTPDLGWTPRLGLINTRLKMAGHQQITQDFLLQTLVTFNPHFDDEPVMSDNKRLGKLVNWIGDKQQKAARQIQNKPSTTSKPDPNNTYYGISKADVQKYAKVGESEFDCAKRLANERNQDNKPASNHVEKKTLVPTAGVWSMGDKHTLKQIQQIDSSITPEHIDAMAKEQSIDKGLVMAKLYQSLATKQKEQDVAAKRNKVGAV